MSQPVPISDPNAADLLIQQLQQQAQQARLQEAAKVYAENKPQ
jgi:hypothetical protein